MIILTGGAGFIGSCFLGKLNSEGIDDIIVVDHFDGSGKWRNLVGKVFRDYIHKDDLLDRIRSGEVPDPRYIVHLGAESSTIHPDEQHYIRNNYEYSKMLADWALKLGIPFLYASSAATYGDGSAGYSDRHEDLQSLVPLNMYGYSKHLFDLWALKNGYLDKITGMKFFNVFGPNEYHKGEMRSLVCKSFMNVKNEGKMTLFKSHEEGYADGEQKRDFIYIKDAVDAMFFLFSSPGLKGIYNIGTGRAKSWNDLAEAMFDAVEREKNITYVDIPPEIRDKYQYFTEADMSKLSGAGYTSQTMPLGSSVKDYVKYLSGGSFL